MSLSSNRTWCLFDEEDEIISGIIHDVPAYDRPINLEDSAYVGSTESWSGSGKFCSLSNVLACRSSTLEESL